jgi:hypothetical protein
VPLQWNSRHESAHEPFFYFSTPELCAAYYRSPLFAFALGHTEFFANRKGAPIIRQLILQTIPIKATPQMNHHLPKLGEIPYESAPLSLNARSNTSGTGQSHWYLDEIFAQLGITNEA